MAFVSQTSNPWDVPVKQALNVMQKIWIARSDYNLKYEITSPSAVYQKVLVCVFFFWFWDPNISQTVQRLADSWRNIIGSNGIMILLAFLNSQPDLQDSDSGRQEFAKNYLEDFRFLYKDSEHEDKKVCDPKMLSYYNNIKIPL